MVMLIARFRAASAYAGDSESVPQVQQPLGLVYVEAD
jgi:hypothetical protein